MAAVYNRSALFLSILVVLATGVLAGCEQPQNQYVAPPPPQVTVARPVQQEVTDYLEFTGNTAAVMTVNIRARVQGYLESMHFESGTLIKKDDLLFVIDPKPFEAKLAAAKAQLASTEAQRMAAESDYQRKKIAHQRGAVTEADLVTALAERNAADAAIEASKATITQAELDLGYTKVTAPIDGRISRNLVDVGNLVGNGQATLLTTIRNYNPINVYFSLNERDLLKVLADRQAAPKEQGEYAGKVPEVPLFMGLANGNDYPFQGKLDFAETGVDPATGTIQLRGVFENSGLPPALIPGLFARVRLPMNKRSDALIVDEQALGSDQSGDYLLVVNSDNVVEKKPIVKGQQIGQMRVINEGLAADDWVVISGILRARPGATVDPQQSEMAMAKTVPEQTATKPQALTEDSATTPQATQEKSEIKSETDPQATQETKTKTETQVASLTEPADESPQQSALTVSSLVDKITERGHLIAAVQRDFKPFSFSDDSGQQVGFDIDLMHEFAKRWLDDEAAVKFLPVFTEGRIPALLEGKADIIAAALTNTPERQQSIGFSLTYFQDGQRLLVLKDSTIRDVCDLDGMKVAVTRTSTANENLQKQAEACAINIQITPVDNPASALIAVKNGLSAAYASDGIALEHFAASGPYKVVGNHFSSEPYGLGLPKDDVQFHKMVDTTLQAMSADGTLAAIYQKWFGDSLSPYPIPAGPGNSAQASNNADNDADNQSPPPAEADPARPSTYTVQSGDTLSKIAGKVYGDVSPGAWKNIYQANQATIGANPANLRRGMVLTIPE